MSAKGCFDPFLPQRRWASVALASISILSLYAPGIESSNGRWLQNWLHSGWTCLDDAGRCAASNGGFQAFLDVAERIWTARRVLHNRRVQVRFLSHLPLSL